MGICRIHNNRLASLDVEECEMCLKERHTALLELAGEMKKRLADDIDGCCGGEDEACHGCADRTILLESIEQLLKGEAPNEKDA